MRLSPEKRLSVRSPWFQVSEDDVEFVMTYNGFDEKEVERVRFRNIFPKGVEMIENARTRILASFFLFDNMYGSHNPKHDIVHEVTELLIQKKKDHPKIKIAVILDPLHRSYARRVSPSVKRFKENGIDVFYSDLLETKGATRIGFFEGLGHGLNLVDNMTAGFFGGLTNAMGSAVKLPIELDGQNVDLSVATGAALMKANHRKILVTDIPEKGTYEALVTSANPHNASDDSTNTGVSVKGELAEFIYGVLREDLANSIKRESSVPLDIGAEKYAYLSDQTRRDYDLPGYNPKEMSRYMREVWPPVNFDKLNNTPLNSLARAKFVSEKEVKKSVLRLLKQAKPDDHIRIQMFYLSDPDVVEAIAKLSVQEKRVGNPIQILLDPSKDAFNSIKDGTPNRQVAHYLKGLAESAQLQIRWYSTHAEQNHAKIMSITNALTGKFQITTGSTNWTGKNMNDINMEANLVIEGSQKLNGDFNQIFDRLWRNEGKLNYTLDYDAYDLKTTRKLVLGYKFYQSLDEDEQQVLEEELKEEIEKRFIDNDTKLLFSMNEEQKSRWSAKKYQKDRSARIRQMSLILGEREVKKSDVSFESWSESYMNKWRQGEKWGYVSW